MQVLSVMQNHLLESETNEAHQIAVPLENPSKFGVGLQAYAGIGRCQHGLKKYADAVKAYEEALKRTPADTEVKAALARAKTGK